MSLKWVGEIEKSVLCGQDQQKQEAVKSKHVTHDTGPDNALSSMWVCGKLKVKNMRWRSCTFLSL